MTTSKWSVVPVVLVAALSGLAGCGGRETRAKAPALAGARAQVPAGTRFAVRLDEPLSLRAAPGTAITAKVLEPIVGTDGGVLVPEGAVLKGRVVDLELHEDANGVRPRLQLAFESIETVSGTAPISARIADPGPNALVAPLPPAAGYDVALERPSTAYEAGGGAGEKGGAWSSTTPFGGGPLPFDEPPAAQNVLIAKDAPLQMTLTAPLSQPRRAPR